jgi:D-alanyl-D-alanine carboxypeptidase
MFLKRAIALSLLALLSVFPMAAKAAVARASIVIDGHTGAVLSRARADSQVYPASLTKVMTIYLLLEEMKAGRLTLDSKMAVSATAASRPASKLYLKPGEKISVKLALEALIVRSANDVATVVAEHIAGSEDAFAKAMTLKARALGMHDTTFKNASGLYNWGQITTVRDLSRLARAVLRDFPDYSYIWSLSNMKYRGHVISSHNHLLKKLKGAIGMKTGYIRASGFNVIAVTERGGRQLITVVVGGRSSRERDRTAMALTETNIARASRKAARLVAVPQPRPAFYPNVSGQPAIKTTPRDAASPIAQSETKPTYQCNSIKTNASGAWMVQLGAYTNFAAAKRRADDVQRDFAQLTEAAEAVIPRVTCNGNTLFRARLAGLDETSARSLCARVGNQNCLALAP